MKTVILGDGPLTKPAGHSRSRPAGISLLPLSNKFIIDPRCPPYLLVTPAVEEDDPVCVTHRFRFPKILKQLTADLTFDFPQGVRFYSFLIPCFSSSSLPVKCHQWLEGWRERGRVSPSHRVQRTHEALPADWLWMFIKLTSPWGTGWPPEEHTPRAQQFSFVRHRHPGLCAFFKVEQRQSGPLHSALFSPCSLVVSFGKEMFCSQEVHRESILHPRHKLLAA